MSCFDCNNSKEITSTTTNYCYLLTNLDVDQSNNQNIIYLSKTSNRSSVFDSPSIYINIQNSILTNNLEKLLVFSNRDFKDDDNKDIRGLLIPTNFKFEYMVKDENRENKKNLDFYSKIRYNREKIDGGWIKNVNLEHDTHIDSGLLNSNIFMDNEKIQLIINVKDYNINDDFIPVERKNRGIEIENPAYNANIYNLRYKGLNDNDISKFRNRLISESFFYEKSNNNPISLYINTDFNYINLYENSKIYLKTLSFNLDYIFFDLDFSSNSLIGTVHFTRPYNKLSFDISSNNVSFDISDNTNTSNSNIEDAFTYQTNILIDDLENDVVILNNILLDNSMNMFLSYFNYNSSTIQYEILDDGRVQLTKKTQDETQDETQESNRYVINTDIDSFESSSFNYSINLNDISGIDISQLFNNPTIGESSLVEVKFYREDYNYDTGKPIKVELQDEEKPFSLINNSIVVNDAFSSSNYRYNTFEMKLIVDDNEYLAPLNIDDNEYGIMFNFEETSN
jgi:hypothetical protein